MQTSFAEAYYKVGGGLQKSDIDVKVLTVFDMFSGLP